MSLSDVLRKVDRTKIQLPDFQRGWVWENDRIRALLASISRGFPIGAVMMLDSGGDIHFKCRPVEGAAVDSAGRPEHFLLDGQQRLTSLYQALRHPGPVDTHDARGRRVRRWYYVDMAKAKTIAGGPVCEQLRGARPGDVGVDCRRDGQGSGR